MAGMGLSGKQLAEGETVVMVLRTHAKALIGPIAVLVALIVAVGAAWRLAPAEYPWILWTVLGIAVIAAARWVILPHLRWMATDYTVTTKRIAMRSGLITREGRDIPLYRINDVASEKGVIDRLFGCGTLIISDASDGPGMTLHDVPHVEDVQVHLHELLFAHDDGSDDGEFPPTEPVHR